jgi:hypothetical protein
MSKHTPTQEAEYALTFGLDRADLKPEVQAEYDRLVAEGRKSGPPDPLAGITQRTSPEVRARILAMIKKGNGKYAKPFDKDRIAAVSLIGTESWADYGQVVLQMAILDTLLSIEEKLDRLAGGQPGKQDTPRCTGGHTRCPGQRGEFHDCGHLGRWPGGRGWRVSSRWSPGALTDGARCLTLLRIGTRCFFAAPADTDEHFGGLMPKDRPDVVLGWGFVRDSLTSPALATAAGALPDTMMTDQAVTELRIQGVSGPDAASMLQHPTVLQVAGDGAAGFFRRWAPDGPGRLSIPWRLEAYSWDRRTEVRLALTWLLLAPFMLYNVAYFMLPPEVPGDASVAVDPVPHIRRSRGHWLAGVVLRLLALAATVQFVGGVVAVLVSTVAWQAAGRHGMLPGWMSWYGQWTAGWRVALALAAVAAVVGWLWRLSVMTAAMEWRTSVARPRLNEAWPLTELGFWHGGELVARQRALHLAAALAAAALIAVLPAGHPAAARWVAVVLSAAMLAAAVFFTALPLADRYVVTVVQRGEPFGRAGRLCRRVLLAALAALLIAAVVSGWTDRRMGPQPGVLPGLSGFLAGLLVVQVVLLVALAVIVARQAQRARAAGCYREVLPYLRGVLAPLVALLGVVVGGILVALITFGVTRLLGTPVPSGFAGVPVPPDALAVPWPIFAFGAALIGLVYGGVIAEFLLLRSASGHRRRFGVATAGTPSPVATYYRDRTAGAADGDGELYSWNRTAIARAWALGMRADQADTAAACVIGFAAGLALISELAAAVSVGSPGLLTVLVGWMQLLVGLLGYLVIAFVLRHNKSARQNAPTLLKRIRTLWDMATFWPRAVHPLTPPSYAERAVPEVVDRIRLLTGHFGHDADDYPRLHAKAGLPDLARSGGPSVPAGPVLLTGYGQGSIIAAAVVAQLPPDVLPDVALLTLACPARRPYGRAFPAYFGDRQLATLANLLDADRTDWKGRWKNLCRRSDPIGSWVFREPEPCTDHAYLAANVDQPCWDPVVLVPDFYPAPPPTHAHKEFWQDPRTSELGAYLVDQLKRRESKRNLGSVTASPGPAGADGTGTTGPMSPSGA